MMVGAVVSVGVHIGEHQGELTDHAQAFGLHMWEANAAETTAQIGWSAASASLVTSPGRS